MSPLISIIVPVYNTERYLAQCLESLVSQTLEDIEIIVVNDGSTDNSQAVVDMYAALWPQKIKAYTKENGGQGDARNFGIAQSSGQYLGFVDSDDWVKPGAFKSAYLFAQKHRCDAVVFDIWSCREDISAKYYVPGYRGRGRFNKLNMILNCTRSLNHVIWNKLYKKELFDGVAFDSILYEDLALVPAVLSYAENIGYLRKALYYYRRRCGSLTYDDEGANNKRLDTINAWDGLIAQVNPAFRQEAEYAVYQHVFDIMALYPLHAASFLEFAQSRRDVFSSNGLIQKDIGAGWLDDLFRIQNPPVPPAEAMPEGQFTASPVPMQAAPARENTTRKCDTSQKCGTSQKCTKSAAIKLKLIFAAKNVLEALGLMNFITSTPLYKKIRRYYGPRLK